MTELSPVKQARRAKILDAAEALFLSQGLRATTMERIAHDVGMSKVTVYSYFKDKDILFLAVADQFAERMENSVRKALSSEGNIPSRIASALIAKHGMVSKQIRSSPFSGDIFNEKNRLSRERFQALDKEIIAEIAALLSDNDLAALLFHASQGIANAARQLDQLETDINRLVRAFVEGVNRS